MKKIYSALFSVVFLLFSVSAYAVPFDSYQYTKTSNWPVAEFNDSGLGSWFTFGEPMADGRLATHTSTSIYLETGLGTGNFELAASFDKAYIAGSDPAFLRVSPDGSKVAVGTGGEGGYSIVTFESSMLNPLAPVTLNSSNSTKYAGVSHYDAKWWGEDKLLLQAAGEVDVLDLATGVTTKIIENVGYSGGIALDADNNLYTAIGYRPAGIIKEFDYADWLTAYNTATPLDFNNDGLYVAQVLSGANLGFDNDGNMHIGGADMFGGSGDGGYVGLINESAIEDLLVNGDPIDLGNSDEFTKFFPIDPDYEYSALFTNYNPVTDEIYVVYQIGDDLWMPGDLPIIDHYSASAVPVPATLLLLVSGMLGIVGLRKNKLVRR